VAEGQTEAPWALKGRANSELRNVAPQLCCDNKVFRPQFDD